LHREDSLQVCIHDIHLSANFDRRLRVSIGFKIFVESILRVEFKGSSLPLAANPARSTVPKFRSRQSLFALDSFYRCRLDAEGPKPMGHGADIEEPDHVLKLLRLAVQFLCSRSHFFRAGSILLDNGIKLLDTFGDLVGTGILLTAGGVDVHSNHTVFGARTRQNRPCKT